MSVSSAQKANKHKAYTNSSVSSPGILEDDVGKPSNNSCLRKKVRKIRRTNDLIYFDISVHENNHVKNKTHKSPLKSSPLPKRNEFSSSYFEDARVKSTIKKLEVASTITDNSSPEFLKKNTTNNAFLKNKTATSHEIPKSNIKPAEKRKIIKARRFFKNNEAQDQTNKQEHGSATVESTKQENLQTNEEIWIEDEKYLSRTEIKKKSLNVHEMTVKTLPSPISPSENSIELNTRLSTISPHLQFNSSKEELHPSTSGIVNVTKRRTYELEDSVIDVSVLKSASTRDSTRINSFPSSDDTENYKTPLKVTMRRKWNKPEHFSAHLNNSPKWVNNMSHKRSSSFSETVDTQQLQKVVTTSKKFVSKVKVPNFAAIHARALDQIESITEYKQRKEDRAKMLLSGLKPNNVEKSSSKEENLGGKKLSSKKKARKQIRFAPDISLTQKSPFIPLPSTPMPRKTKHAIESPLTPLPDEGKKFDLAFSKENKLIEGPAFKQHNVEISPVKSCCPEYIKKFNFVSSKENKFTQIPVLKQNYVDKKVLTMKNGDIKETFKGFSSKTKNEARKHEIKSVATKSKPVSNTLELKRCAIKGVRSNRRFELLMNMRKGK